MRENHNPTFSRRAVLKGIGIGAGLALYEAVTNTPVVKAAELLAPTEVKATAAPANIFSLDTSLMLQESQALQQTETTWESVVGEELASHILNYVDSQVQNGIPVEAYTQKRLVEVDAQGQMSVPSTILESKDPPLLPFLKQNVPVFTAEVDEQNEKIIVNREQGIYDEGDSFIFVKAQIETDSDGQQVSQVVIPRITKDGERYTPQIQNNQVKYTNGSEEIVLGTVTDLVNRTHTPVTDVGNNMAYAVVQETTGIGGGSVENSTETDETGYTLEKKEYTDAEGETKIIFSARLPTDIGIEHILIRPEFVPEEGAKFTKENGVFDLYTATDGLKYAIYVPGENPQLAFYASTDVGNNLRSGPGTTYDIPGKSAATVAVVGRSESITNDPKANGIWYKLWNSQNTEEWLWSDLATLIGNKFIIPEEIPVAISQQTAEPVADTRVVIKETVEQFEDIDFPEDTLRKENNISNITAEHVTLVQGAADARFNVWVSEGEVPRLVGNPEKDTWREVIVRDIADVKGINIGMEAPMGWLQNWNDKSDYVVPIVKEFNGLASAYELAWHRGDPSEKDGIFRPSADKFHWSAIDKMGQAAQSNSQRMIMSHAIYPYDKRTAPWIKDRFAQGRGIEFLVDHTTQLATHMETKFPGIVQGVSGYYEHLGNSTDKLYLSSYIDNDPAYIVEPTKALHEVAPDWIVGYSDFGIEFGSSKSEQVFSQVNRWRNAGAYFNALFYQGHFHGQDFFTQGIANLTARFAAQLQRCHREDLIPVIQEMDIDMTSYTGNINPWDFQKVVAKAMLETAFANGVTIVHMFGAPDHLNWKEKDYGRENADPTMYNVDTSTGKITKKPFYWGVMQALAGA